MQIYRKLYNWEMELSESTDPGVREILSYQKNEANNEFAKFIKNRYLDWFAKPDDDTPVMSQNLIRKKVFPVVDAAPGTYVFSDRQFPVRPVAGDQAGAAQSVRS